MIDTHCHLDHCDPPDGELVERAREAGLTRLATVGTGPGSVERAIEAAGAHDDVFAQGGVDGSAGSDAAPPRTRLWPTPTLYTGRNQEPG